VGVRSWRLPERIRSVKQGALQNGRLKSAPRKAEEDGGRDDHIQMGTGNDFPDVDLLIFHYFFELY
jgi:hypothetical protein